MRVRGTVVSFVVAWGCAGDAQPRVTDSPARGPQMNRSGYPNVHVRLHLTQHTPDHAPRDCEVEIWLKDTRFHVRDLSGRRVDEILGDVTAPRQLGALPRTMEELMDRDAVARGRASQPPPPTELYGDLASDDGWIYAPRRPPAEMRAAKLAPAAEQILARNKMTGLQIGATATRLGRPATEYHGFVMVSDDGEPYQNDVTRAISPPYLLFEATRSTGNAELSYVREIVALEEGGVTDADVTPPAK
jgi:hypothetical protein